MKVFLVFLSLWTLVFVFANNIAFPYEIALEYYAFTFLPAADQLKMVPGFTSIYNVNEVGNFIDFFNSVVSVSAGKSAVAVPLTPATFGLSAPTDTVTVNQITSTMQTQVTTATNANAKVRFLSDIKNMYGGMANFNSLMSRLSDDLAAISGLPGFSVSTVNSLSQTIQSERAKDFFNAYTNLQNILGTSKATAGQQYWNDLLNYYFTIDPNAQTLELKSGTAISVPQAWDDIQTAFTTPGQILGAPAPPQGFSNPKGFLKPQAVPDKAHWTVIDVTQNMQDELALSFIEPLC